MNRTEIEALLFRVQDAYPAAAPPREGTVDEWTGSTLHHFSPATVFAAFDDWKEGHDWPPTIHQMIEQTQETARRVVLEQHAVERSERARHLSGGTELHRCGECRDLGSVELRGPDDTDATPTRWRPCSTCNRKAYERWAAHHYEPNHDCHECHDARRGRHVERT